MSDEQEFNPRSVNAVLSCILAEQRRTNENQERLNQSIQTLIDQHEESKARISRIELAHQRVIGAAVVLSAAVSALGPKLWKALFGGSGS